MEYLRLLARYNRIANERLYAACSQLDEADYRKHRSGSFGSIHGLLNHVLLADRIWMARFEGGGSSTPALDTVLFDDFAELRAARAHEDARIEVFFAQPLADRPIVYTNSRGVQYTEQPIVAMTHFFNHQTHHRGQVHVMLAQTPVAPPSLDLHRIINP